MLTIAPPALASAGRQAVAEAHGAGQVDVDDLLEDGDLELLDPADHAGGVDEHVEAVEPAPKAATAAPSVMSSRT